MRTPGFRFLLASLLSWGSACRGPDVNYDCENQKLRFMRAADDEEIELQPLPERPPFAVAIRLSEDGLNRLLVNVIADDVPLSGQVPFGILPQGPGEASFSPAGVPRLALAPVRGCPTCVVLETAFRVALSAQNDPLSTGVGTAGIAIPISLSFDEETGTSTVIAHYSQSTIVDWKLAVWGFNSEEHDSLAGAVRRLLEESVQDEFGEVELLRIGSWKIGANQVKLAAREVIVQPEQKQIVLGLTSNLPLPGSGVAIEQTLPDETPMMVSFAHELMLSMTHRMFTEGEISRRYDEDGQPEPEGTYGVTMNAITPVATDDETLATEFVIWRVQEGYCGRAAVQMPLALALNEASTAIIVDAGPATLIQGHPDNEGVGVAAEEDVRLVEENQDLVEVFRGQLEEQLSKTLSYEDIAVSNSRILFETQDVSVSERSIDTLVDFTVYAVAE